MPYACSSVGVACLVTPAAKKLLGMIERAREDTVPMGLGSAYDYGIRLGVLCGLVRAALVMDLDPDAVRQAAGFDELPEA